MLRCAKRQRVVLAFESGERGHCCGRLYRGLVAFMVNVKYIFWFLPFVCCGLWGEEVQA